MSAFVRARKPAGGVSSPGQSSIGRRLVAEAVGTALLPGRGGRLRDHGRAPRRRQRRRRAAGEHAGHRRGAGRAHPDLRADLGCALQSRRSRWPTPRRAASRGARCRPTSWRRSPAPSSASPPRTSCSSCRCSSPRVTRGPAPAQLFSEFVATFGLLAVIWGCARSRPATVPFAVGRLHHGRLLVHGVHVVRQPGGDAGAVGHRHLRGHPARRRSRLHRRAAPRRRGGDRAVPMAAAAIHLESSRPWRRWRWTASPPDGWRPAPLTTRLATPADAAAIAAIYNEGIADRDRRPSRRSRARRTQIAALLAGQGRPLPHRGRRARRARRGLGRRRSRIGSRPAYAGVAEHSVYVAREARGTGAGRAALEALCQAYAERGFWKIVSRIFPENTASLACTSAAGSAWSASIGATASSTASGATASSSSDCSTSCGPPGPERRAVDATPGTPPP